MQNYDFLANCFIYLIIIAGAVFVFSVLKTIFYQSPEEKEKWRKFDEKMAAHKKKMAAFEKDRKTNPVWKELDDFMDSMDKTPLYTTAPSSTYYATHGHKANTTNQTQQKKWEEDNFSEDEFPDYVTDPTYSHLPCNIYHR